MLFTNHKSSFCTALKSSEIHTTTLLLNVNSIPSTISFPHCVPPVLSHLGTGWHLYHPNWKNLATQNNTTWEISTTFYWHTNYVAANDLDDPWPGLVEPVSVFLLDHHNTRSCPAIDKRCHLGEWKSLINTWKEFYFVYLKIYYIYVAKTQSEKWT